MTTGSHSLMLSLFKSSSEMFLNEEPINFGSITACPKTQSFRNIFNYDITQYNHNSNLFKNKTIKNEDIVTFENKRFPDQQYSSKFEKIPVNKLDLKHCSTYWNNNNLKNLYSNIENTLFEDNAFILDTAGNLERKPSDIVNINVDRSLKYLKSDNPESLDEIKHKYKVFEGLWIISNVHTYVFQLLEDTNRH